jgi:peptide/nickel transport system substrate-binding protein
VTAAIFADPAGFHRELTNPGGSRGSEPGLSELWQMTHAGLTYLDDDEAVRAWLATELPTADNGQWRVLAEGRMEMTWKLRPNIRWHDGTPFSPADLQFTLDIYRDRDLAILNPAALRLIEGIEALDDNAVVVRWAEPFIEADRLFSPQLAMPLPKHLLEPAYQQDKEGFLNLPYWRDSFVGTGPYRLQEWVPGSHAVLVASDSYVLGRPKIDEVEVKFFTERNTLAASIMSGDVQRPFGRGLALEQVVQINESAKDVNVLLGSRQGNVMPMYPQFINTDPPIVRNVEMRRALLMGIDRAQMGEALNFGLGRIAHSWLQPDRPEYKPVESKIVRYEYDVRRATQMIEQLGYTKGSDGVFRDGRGEKLAIRVQTTEGNALQPPSALSVVDSWQRLGIDTSLENVPNQRLRDREYRAQFPAFELVTSGVSVKSSYMRAFHGGATPLLENNFSGGNRARYQNPELDGLIDRYLVTIPMPERMALLGDIIHHQTDQLTIMPLFFAGLAWVLGDKHLKNVSSDKTWNAHLWELS